MRLSFLVTVWLAMMPPCVNAQFRLTEFMASNTRGLTDENGDHSDWVEVQNTASTNASLLNWSLSNNRNHSAGWFFPATNIAPGNFLVVFASGKNRRRAGLPLHTDFRLDAGGEYLALFRPDATVATEFSPAYPPQFPDVSYGVGMQVLATTLVSSNAPLRFRIPNSDAEKDAWTQLGFDDAHWELGTNGIGYDTGVYDPAEQSFTANVLQSTPVAYWRLNETSGPAAANIGSAGVAYEAGYQGSILLGQTGPRSPEYGMFEPDNLAPIFDGTTAFVHGPYQLLNDTAAFTLAGWIRPTGPQQSRTGLFGQNDVIECGFIDAATLQLWSPVGSLNYTYPHPADQWHLVVATGDSRRMALYLDGNLAAETSVSVSTYGNSDFDFNIGGGGVFDGSGNYFRGQIDEVAVWDRALSASEVAGLASSNATEVSFAPYLNTDVRVQMLGVNATAHVRIPFQATNPAVFESLQLLMRYDDGFVAYLNGHEIARTNAPDQLAWNSAALKRQPDALAIQWTAFDVSAALPLLQTCSISTTWFSKPSPRTGFTIYSSACPSFGRCICGGCAHSWTRF